MTKTQLNHIVLIPVFNDWVPLSQTVREIGLAYTLHQFPAPYFVIVNDGSTHPAPDVFQKETGCSGEIIHLHTNLGHQKAIVIGLSYVHARYTFRSLAIMDADGEDTPAGIMQLLQSSSFPDKIIMARRTERKDRTSFQILYRLYQLFFYALTGRKMAFGNFCLLSEAHTGQLVYRSEIWNNVAGGILKSGIAHISVPVAKGKRTHGHSKMNLTSLIMHGLNSISVFIEIISVRILILSFVIIILSLMGIGAIAFIRIFTDYAIPGWASILASSMLVVLLQSFLISLTMIVIFLSSQAQRKFIPAHHYADYLKDTEKWKDEE